MTPAKACVSIASPSQAPSSSPFFSSSRRLSTQLNRDEILRLVAECDATLALDPGCLHTRAVRGHACMKAKLWDHAAADFSFILEARPGDLHGRFSRGMASFKSGRVVEAHADFSRVLELNPHHVMARYARAGCYNTEGKFHHAIQEYTIALQHDEKENDGTSRGGGVGGGYGRGGAGLRSWETRLLLPSRSSGWQEYDGDRRISYKSPSRQEEMISHRQHSATAPPAVEAAVAPVVSKQQQHDLHSQEDRRRELLLVAEPIRHHGPSPATAPVPAPVVRKARKVVQVKLNLSTPVVVASTPPVPDPCVHQDQRQSLLKVLPSIERRAGPSPRVTNSPATAQDHRTQPDNIVLPVHSHTPAVIPAAPAVVAVPSLAAAPTARRVVRRVTVSLCD